MICQGRIMRLVSAGLSVRTGLRGTYLHGRDMQQQSRAYEVTGTSPYQISMAQSHYHQFSWALTGIFVLTLRSVRCSTEDVWIFVRCRRLVAVVVVPGYVGKNRSNCSSRSNYPFYGSWGPNTPGLGLSLANI